MVDFNCRPEMTQSSFHSLKNSASSRCLGVATGRIENMRTKDAFFHTSLLDATRAAQ
jgi:hypothetical protein